MAIIRLEQLEVLDGGNTEAGFVVGVALLLGHLVRRLGVGWSYRLAFPTSYANTISQLHTTVYSPPLLLSRGYQLVVSSAAHLLPEPGGGEDGKSSIARAADSGRAKMMHLPLLKQQLPSHSSCKYPIRSEGIGSL